ncbi:hypothetical protein Tco_0020658 [Tanacetum coccineum]
MSVWDKIFKWWKVGDVNAFSIDEFFSSNVNVNVPPTFYGFGKRLFGLPDTLFGKKGMLECLAISRVLSLLLVSVGSGSSVSGFAASDVSSGSTIDALCSLLLLW